MKKTNYRGSSYMNIVQGKLESNPRFSNYTGDANAGVGTMSSTNSKITYKIINASNVDGTFIMFGNDEFYVPNGYANNSGCSTGVSVTVSQSSAQQVAADSAKGPMNIAGFKVSTSDLTNFSHEMFLRTKSSTGRSVEDPIDFNEYRNPVNQQDKLLVAMDFNITITGMHALKGTITAGTNMTFYFILAARVNIGAVLNNQPAVSINTANFPLPVAPVMLVPTKTSTGQGVAQNLPLVNGSAVSLSGSKR